MNRLHSFIARKIYKDINTKVGISSPAIKIAVCGITLGLSVILLSVAIIFGFKEEVRSKISGFCSDLTVTGLDYSSSYETNPLRINDSIIAAIASNNHVRSIQRYSTKTGIIKTDDDFYGAILKGIGSDYDTHFLQAHITQGAMPRLDGDRASNEILLSETIANKLGIALGDQIYVYFIKDNIRGRKLTVKGIYRTYFSEFDKYFIISDIRMVNNLNGWEADEASGLEVRTDRTDDSLRETLYAELDKFYSADEYVIKNVEDIYPDIFAWLKILDINVWVILFLMLGLSIFSMSSGLLILMLERINMIGMLKAMGGTNGDVKNIFLYLSAFILLKGMVYGNAIALLVIFLQKHFHFLRLDPEIYYSNFVPMSIHIPYYLLINVGTLAVSLAVLLIPAALISKIKPARSIRFE